MNKKNLAVFLITGIFMLFLFTSTFALLSNHDANHLSVVINNMLLNIPICIAGGCVDYYIIKFLHKKLKNKLGLGIIVLDIFLISLIMGVIISVCVWIWSHHLLSVTQILSSFTWNSLFVLLLELLIYTQDQIEYERKIMAAEKEKALYQLYALKTQVNPHFLFNSLNVLASLTYESPELANKFVKKLSAVYRYILTTSQNPTVNLSEEMRFVSTYLYLEKMRHGNSLLVEIKEMPNMGTRQIIPVSVQVLVENALKHNIATPDKPLTILIEEGMNGVTVSNNIQRRNNVNNTGVGLKNLRKQYELHHQQIIISNSNNEFMVFIPYIKQALKQRVIIGRVGS
jgi:hypothetical protein